MYSSVWNRVALLAAGMALGWNLVNYWAVPDSVKSHQFTKVAMGAVGGLIVLVALALSNMAAAIVGLFIFGLSALVAYAGNARHISSLPVPLPLLQPARPLQLDPRVGVLIAHAGEPASYDGPQPWALRWQVRANQGRPTPGWFSRPRIYARIRAAYHVMPASSSLDGTLVGLVATLSQALGKQYVVELGYLAAEPAAIATLTEWAKAGLTRAIVLPLHLSAEGADLLRSEIARSRVREVGLGVTLLEPISLDGQLPDTYGERFDMLCRGEPPPTIQFSTEIWARELAERVVNAS